LGTNLGKSAHTKPPQPEPFFQPSIHELCGGKQCKMTLAVEEFIHRFLLHVLPKGFVRIRQYGRMANRCRREGAVACRALLVAGPPPPSASGELGCRRCLDCGGILEIVEMVLPRWLSHRRPSPRHAPNTS